MYDGLHLYICSYLYLYLYLYPCFYCTCTLYTHCIIPLYFVSTVLISQVFIQIFVLKFMYTYHNIFVYSVVNIVIYTFTYTLIHLCVYNFSHIIVYTIIIIILVMFGMNTTMRCSITDAMFNINVLYTNAFHILPFCTMFAHIITYIADRYTHVILHMACGQRQILCKMDKIINFKTQAYTKIRILAQTRERKLIINNRITLQDTGSKKWHQNIYDITNILRLNGQHKPI